MKVVLSTVLALVFLASLFISGARQPLEFSDAKQAVLWDVLPVSGKTQADANLLRFPDGITVLIDAGEVKPLVPQLKKLGVTRIDKILISHPHIDHYGGIPALLESDIAIGEVDMNVPDQSVCDREKGWGCDRNAVLELMKQLAAHHVKVKSVVAGDVPVQSGNARLEVLYAFDGVKTPVGPTDANDTSAIQLLTVGSMHVLFPGDLNRPIAAYLVSKQDPRLHAQLLKVPHHGGEGVADDPFFDWVAPGAGFVPTTSELWNSDRCKRVRTWFKANKIPVFVTGLVGRVHVSIESEGYRISLPSY